MSRIVNATQIKVALLIYKAWIFVKCLKCTNSAFCYILKVIVCQSYAEMFGTRKAEVLNSLIINTTAKANDTTDILHFSFLTALFS